MAPINVLDFKGTGLKGGGHIELLYGGVDEGGGGRAETAVVGPGLGRPDPSGL